MQQLHIVVCLRSDPLNVTAHTLIYPVFPPVLIAVHRRLELIARRRKDGKISKGSRRLCPRKVRRVDNNARINDLKQRELRTTRQHWTDLDKVLQFAG